MLLEGVTRAVMVQNGSPKSKNIIAFPRSLWGNKFTQVAIPSKENVISHPDGKPRLLGLLYTSIILSLTWVRDEC